MFKSVRFKLFLTFLLTTLLVVSGMYAFVRWSLNHGFNEFIQARQQERVTNLLEGLTEYYAGNRDWRDLAAHKQKWIDLLWQSNPRRQQPMWSQQALAESNNVWPPNLPEAPARRNFIPFEFRVMLLDADRRIIFGRPESLPKLNLSPIKFQETTVGYLGVVPGRVMNQASEVRFLETQSDAFIWIALMMVGLSAGLALLLAYILGKPLKRITSAAKALAVGRYDVRLPVESTDELGQLARDFNDMATALQQSEQARQRWVADISHELRTPLAVLRGELEALQDGVRPLVPEAIDSLCGEVMRLHRLTEDLYQLTLSDQGALSYHKAHIDPVAILKDDLEALKPEFQHKQIQVAFTDKLAGAVKIYADPDRLSQLFRNLLHNSANYTDVGGQLAIVISREAETLRLNFSDSFPGVPDHELPKVFDRFYRLESSRNRHLGGAGLGLAICNNIVNAHGGKIAAHASALQGLTIIIELPISS
jgi:two-component system sensor histidine kinase BaeS